MKILVVDDSKLARLSLIKAVKNVEPSTEFFEAENGAIAVEIFKKEMPRVVFLDLTMPVMDGYEALIEIMKIDPDSQVIVVSADIQAQARERVLSLGAKNMCAKPINDEKMQNIFINDLII
ncbi:response regulator [Sulfurimonas gotlandica]|uniref:response regulator n=1 Tax=Sulfurimonas gotlandica TaxID=1176482 RepID=UPI00030371EF|nr:response regulator [Sulfurimonas gotlandica]